MWRRSDLDIAAVRRFTVDIVCGAECTEMKQFQNGQQQQQKQINENQIEFS
jgi:hypothetical protein